MRPTFRALLEHQVANFPAILRELDQHGRKVGHWAWWVFPTDLSGRSEPPPHSCVMPDERSLLLRSDTAPQWRTILERIAALVEAENSWSGVLPPIDHGRVEVFIDYWDPQRAEAEWFDSVLATLQSHHR